MRDVRTAGARVTAFLVPDDDMGNGKLVPCGRHGVRLDGQVALLGSAEELAGLGAILSMVYGGGPAADREVPSEVRVGGAALTAALSFDDATVRRLLEPLSWLELIYLAEAARTVAAAAYRARRAVPD